MAFPYTGPGSGHNTINESVITYNGTSASIHLDKELEYNVFPNPASDMINILVGNDMPNNLQLHLVNNLGQIIYTQDHLQPTIPYSINFKSLPKGIYFIRLYSSEKISTKKIFIN